MANNKKQTIHKARLDLIRPYVDFNYDKRYLSDYQKRKIKTYYDVIVKLKARPHYVYHPRKKERLKVAQQYSQHEVYLKGLKVAFVPTDGKTKPKLKFDAKNKTMSVSGSHVKSKNLSFDMQKLIENPLEHVKETLKNDPTAKNFTLQAGAFEIPGAMEADFVPEEIIARMRKYGDKDKNNYFGNWLYGLKSHTFKKQADWNEYANAKRKASDKLKKEADKQRRKIRKARKK